MEIKIQCACGTKYKFDVEPVNGRMPAPATCPVCGADGTEQANEFLRAALPPAPPPTASAIPIPPPAPAALRIGRPAPAPAEAAPAPEAYTPPVPRPTAPMRRAPAEPPADSKGPLVGTLVAVLILAGLGYSIWKFGDKWFKRLQTVSTVASVLGDASAGSDDEAPRKQNFWYQDCVVLFIRHTNHLEVAQACKDYWSEKLRKNLTITQASEDSYAAGEYEVIPPHNGYVRILGSLEWPRPEFEGLSQHLSQKFNTLVFEMRDVDFSGAYHFGVYEQGTKKFHAQMDVKITSDNADEIVTTEGNDWAIAHGYKPGAEGFKEFHLGDADEITQRMGMKLWDEKEGTELKGLLLKETPAR